MKKHKNIFLALSGHVLGYSVGRRVDKGENGNDVYQILSNFQSWDYAWLRIMTFYPGAGGQIERITVKSFSPDQDRFWWDGFKYKIYEIDQIFDIDLVNAVFTPPKVMPSLQNASHGAKIVRELNFKVFPNPFRSTTKISIGGIGNLKNLNLKIFNIEGELVTRVSNIGYSNNEIVLNKRSLSTGVYIAKLQVGQRVLTKKLVVAN